MLVQPFYAGGNDSVWKGRKQKAEGKALGIETFAFLNWGVTTAVMHSGGFR